VAHFSVVCLLTCSSFRIICVLVGIRTGHLANTLEANGSVTLDVYGTGEPMSY
jgi:hypothetical protein